MSVYTTQIRWIVEQKVNDKSLPIGKQIEKACPLIFNFDFPIWSESYRNILETKILRHYFNKEIGFETFGLWQFYLESRMNEIMPYYNQLYLTTVKDYDYLTDVNMTETLHRTETGDETADYTAKEDIGETGKIVSNGSENSNSTGKIDTTDNTDISSTVDTTGNGSLTHGGTDSRTDTHSGESHQTTNVDADKHSTTLRSDMPQANYAGLDYATNYDKFDESHDEDTQVNGQDDYTNTSTGKNDYTDKTTNTGKETTSGSNDRTIGTKSSNDVDITNSNTTDTTKNIGKDNTSKNVVDRNTEEDYTRIRKGASGRLSFQELIMKYRESLINIDMMIIGDLADLFMMVY